ncbi:PREDICTED: SWI/SNF complex subunit SWI3B-like isoform X1 [Camelina sativa]|uniref:SWI/SNF complex subunit SWI3B-like isoform X1 n=1 Tax=Camelina sativa TaxID=90675 RepID=A0ABM0WDA9_CAMSA|nr:PREDICTED: SWI/SNF complex subunit SWI3B-like isoform X1 [Camelina sativa]
MAAKAPDSGGSGEILPITPSLSETTSGVTAASQSTQPPSSSSDVDTVYVPSYSRWFSWTDIDDCEVRSLPEFFNSKSSSKNPKFYIYLRNSIIKQYRDDHPRKISFTDVRRTLVSDVVSIRRVFDFLEYWGLINHSSSSSAKPLKWDEKSAGDASSEPPTTVKETAKRICNGCKSICSVACFVCDKYELTLCARCYVRGNYRVGINSTEFKRVELSEESKKVWSEKETLQLMEAVMHYGDDWKKVATHVTGRTEKDCVSQFVKLPFGEQFVKESDSEDSLEAFDKIKGSADLESGGSDKEGSSPNKRMRLTPLADASNPIMAQAAFLSALAGTKVAEAAARAAVTALSDVDYEAEKNATGDPHRQDANANSGGDITNSERAWADAKSLIQKEEQEVEGAIKEIVEVEMKKIRDRIVHFEKLDLEMERSRKQLEDMKNLLFTDQLNIFFHTRKARKSEDRVDC